MTTPDDLVARGEYTSDASIKKVVDKLTDWGWLAEYANAGWNLPPAGTDALAMLTGRAAAIIVTLQADSKAAFDLSVECRARAVKAETEVARLAKVEASVMAKDYGKATEQFLRKNTKKRQPLSDPFLESMVVLAEKWTDVCAERAEAEVARLRAVVEAAKKMSNHFLTYWRVHHIGTPTTIDAFDAAIAALEQP